MDIRDWIDQRKLYSAEEARFLDLVLLGQGPRHPLLRPKTNVDTRIWHAMQDERCFSFAQLAETLAEYRFRKANWGRACQKRLMELVAEEARDG